MSENDKLQNLFDSFSMGLREYIQEEVKRQVAQATSSMEVEEEEDADVGASVITSSVANTGAVTDNEPVTDIIKDSSIGIDAGTGAGASIGTGTDNSIQGTNTKNPDDFPDLFTSDLSTKSSNNPSTFSGIQILLDKIKTRKSLA